MGQAGGERSQQRLLRTTAWNTDCSISAPDSARIASSDHLRAKGCEQSLDSGINSGTRQEEGEEEGVRVQVRNQSAGSRVKKLAAGHHKTRATYMCDSIYSIS